MKKVLAAVDFSQVSERVIERAAAIAEAFGAGLALVHVAAPDPGFVGYAAGPQTVRDFRAEQLREEHRELQARAEALRAQGIDAEAFLVQGTTTQTILERAEALGADLIIVGSHGKGALHRALLGSVSEGVLKKASCPVLVVPSAERADG